MRPSSDYWWFCPSDEWMERGCQCDSGREHALSMELHYWHSKIEEALYQMSKAIDRTGERE